MFGEQLSRLTLLTATQVQWSRSFASGAMSTENVEMRPAQCRAGRALLEMTQPQLAKLAGLGLWTVVDLRRNGGKFR